jgi:cell division protein FtsB
MPTRLKKPSILKQLGITALLLAFQGYLGFSAIGGQFGTESQKQMQLDIGSLKAKSASLQVELEAIRHRNALFDPARIDPDILSERARALLNMAHADDVIIMTDPKTGLPISGSSPALSADRLSDVIETGID